jgi:hypothetical protein
MRFSRPLILERLEDRCVPSTEPVLLVPGFQGSLPLASQLTNFLHNLGVQPTQLAVTSFYAPLAAAFTSAGYHLGTTLFTVPYDWRLPMAPADGNPDGIISGVTAASITDNVYQYGIDYLGYALKVAAQTWIAIHPNNPLTQVDVVAHSEGGLIARAYLQSTAYGGTFVSDTGQSLPLPKIDRLIEVGTPNYGVSSSWEAWNGNFSDYVFFGGLSQSLLQSYATDPYNFVLGGGTINGGPAPINLQSITNQQTGQPDPVLFMRQYWAVLGQLSADYNFLMIHGRLTNANNLLGIFPVLTDFNGGADPNAWASLANSVSLVYATADATLNYDLQRVGPPGQTYTITSGFTNVVPGQVWDQTLVIPNDGDQVVPVQTTAQPYINDARFAKFPQTSQTITHFTLVSNPGVLNLLVSLVTAPAGAFSAKAAGTVLDAGRTATSPNTSSNDLALVGMGSHWSKRAAPTAGTDHPAPLLTQRSDQGSVSAAEWRGHSLPARTDPWALVPWMMFDFLNGELFSGW